MSSLEGWNKPPVSGVWDLGSSCPFCTSQDGWGVGGSLAQPWRTGDHQVPRIRSSRSATSHRGAPHRPCQAPRSQEQRPQGPPEPPRRRPPQQASSGRPRSQTCRELTAARPSPAQHPRQARALISATGARWQAREAPGRRRWPAGGARRPHSRPEGSLRMCTCAGARRDSIGGVAQRVSHAPSVPPRVGRLEWTSPSRRSAGSAPAPQGPRSGVRGQSEGVSPSLTPPVSASRRCAR